MRCFSHSSTQSLDAVASVGEKFRETEGGVHIEEYILWGGCTVEGSFSSVLQCVAVLGSVLQRVAACCSVLQCVAVRCSVLQCVAVRCSALHSGGVIQQ